MTLEKLLFILANATDEVVAEKTQILVRISSVTNRNADFFVIDAIDICPQDSEVQITIKARPKS